MASCTFNRPHHRRIASFLSSLDADFLAGCGCYFGGGTAIVLLLNEYRESVDVDFLCSSTAGYRTLREAYGRSIDTSYAKAIELVDDPIYLASCLRKMQMASDVAERIPRLLRRSLSTASLSG